MSIARRLPLLKRKKRTPFLFDDAFYRAQSDDLRNVGDGWKHYCMHGFRENRNPHPLFHTSIYRSRYLPDQKDINPVLHYLDKHVPLASPHPLFDAKSYLAAIGDMPTTTLLEHFLNTPNGELASASALFDSQAYLAAYPDVAACNANPLMHFLRHGITENRISFFDPNQVDRLYEFQLVDWYKSAPFVRPRDFLFKFIHANQIVGDRNRPSVICVANRADASYGSRTMADLAASIRGECNFNVASLLIDGGELCDKFEAIGPTVTLDAEHSVEMHASALLRYFVRTIKLFRPVCAFVDSAALPAVLPSFQEAGIEIMEVEGSPDDTAESPIDFQRIDSIKRLIPPTDRSAALTNHKPTSDDVPNTSTSLHRNKNAKRVFFLSPSWEVSGVNTFTELLCRELNNRDYEATILLTNNMPMGLPPERLPKVPFEFLHATRPKNSVKNARLVEFLSAMSPAVVIPNFDYRSSMIAANLPETVQTLGILHSDDSDHYTHGYRMGHNWERIVSVSETIERKLLKLNPAFAEKSRTINYGVDAPEDLENVANQERTIGQLKIVYSGRLVQQQKRILDFAELLQALRDREVPFQFTMIGDGQQADELRELAAPFAGSGQLRMLGRLQPDEIYAELVNHHAICLMSDYEGLPLSLLEGLACGCIPVMTQIESGVSEILSHGQNALMSPLRNPELVADNLHQLFHDNNLRSRLAAAARPTLVANRLTATQMVDRYDDLLGEMFSSMENGSTMTLPPFWRCRWVDQLLDAA